MSKPLLEFSNVGMRSRFRSFRGFPPKSVAERYDVAPRGSLCVRLNPIDLLSLSGAGATVALAVFGENGDEAPEILGLSREPLDSLLNFDSAQLCQWMQNRGLKFDQERTTSVELADQVVLKAGKSCTVWIMLPAKTSDVVAGADSNGVEVSVSRVAPAISLPEPLGNVVREFTVQRGTAHAYPLAAGQYAQIIDIEGQQCSDFQAFRSQELSCGEEIMIDSTATRSMVRRSYPGPGLLDKFYDRDARPLLQMIQDTCGRHDTFGLACTARGYEDRGFPGHVNCSDNISEAMTRFGVRRRAAWPAVNFFWNTWVDPETQHILTEESYSRPGDYVIMKALTDLVCVSTACPDDIDPINGWNPTDVHVRIYGPQTPINRAVAYRVKEDATMTISRESAFHSRTSVMTQDMAPARDIWVPTSFPMTGTLGEYWATREHVTLQDMSSLRKYDIVGPDAEFLLQQLLTKDLTRLALWRGTYALMCDETGTVVDDGTLFRLGPQLFRWCCGTEESARRIEELAKSEGLQARLSNMSDTLANVALQGPKSRDLLAGTVFTQPHVPSLEQLKWFGVTVGRLNDREGVPFMLSRTGYTGELGYELFCAQSDAACLWDALMQQGEPNEVSPMGTAALEVIRIEAGLAAPGTEFGPGRDAWEAGLGFAIDLRKQDFVGKNALERNARDPRRKLKGLLLGGNDVPRSGAGVFMQERQIGHVTSATRSPMLERGIAMALLAVEFAENDTELEVGMMDGRMKRLPARVTDIPFVDPQRERARA